MAKPESIPSWSSVTAQVVQGHRVASGLNGNPRFPGGTLRMQIPHFAALGVDLTRFHLGTLNVSVAPYRYRVIQAPATYRQLKWHPVEPAEDFSFFDVWLTSPQGITVEGKIYHPHPETKPEHFQRPEVLELLLPHLPGLSYGDDVVLAVPRDQMVFEPCNS